MRVRIRVVEFETHLQAYCVWPATHSQAVQAECPTSRGEEFLDYWRRIAGDGDPHAVTDQTFEFVRNIKPHWAAHKMSLWEQVCDAFGALTFRRRRELGLEKQFWEADATAKAEGLSGIPRLERTLEEMGLNEEKIQSLRRTDR